MTPIEEIEINGYTVLKGFIKDVKRPLDKILELEKTSPKVLDEYTPRLNKGAPNIYNLAAKDKYFLDLFTKSERLETILIYFLNDPYYKQIPQHLPNYILRSLGARSSGPNELPLHIDSFKPSLGPYVTSMQCILLLEPSTVETGCTIAIKGSHLLGKYADDSQRHITTNIEAEPGDLLIQDARIIHGANANVSGKTRWSLVSTFTSWHITQHFSPYTIPLEIFNLLDVKEKHILGFNTQPLIDETKGVDIKKGYEL